MTTGTTYARSVLARATFDVTAKEAAEQLGVHAETIKRWARKGLVPARKNLSGVWLFDQQTLDDLPVHEVRGDG